MPIKPPPPNPPTGLDPSSPQFQDWLFLLWKWVLGLAGRFVDLDFTGSNITSILIRNHNDLQNFQGGSASGDTGGAEYYHATFSRYNWPEVKERIAATETMRIDPDYQVAIHGGTFTIDGTAILGGTLYVII